VTVLETFGLGKRYRSGWALSDCTLAIPAGHIVALVGPNGAGKTTLLNCAVGLLRPSSGSVRVLGGLPAGSPGALERVAYVAQDAPLVGQLPTQEMITVARCLNPGFDVQNALRRLQSLEIPLRTRVAKLSGGQQAQLALTLALARHPELLILDEPIARLDPVARHDFMTQVVTAVAEDGLSVIFSSHVVSELERVADYLLLLSRGRVALAGPIDEVLAEHACLSGPADDVRSIANGFDVLDLAAGRRHARVLVRGGFASGQAPAGWESDDVGLEELILAYLRRSPLPSGAGDFTGGASSWQAS